MASHDSRISTNLTSENEKDSFHKHKSPKLSLSHCNTICMVPPPEHSSKAWEALTKARIQLRDPGLYRWPPHANIIYPFINFDKQQQNQQNQQQQNDTQSICNETISLLQNVATKIEPFDVTLDSLGCFGGKKRGVLWVYPNSSINNEEPLIQLQSYLQDAFPETKGKKGGPYIPHMTLSHFICLEDALIAKESIEEWWDNSISFSVDKIYALKRVGDDGQFKIQVTIPLGQKYASNIIVHDPPIPFPDMPDVEEDWVHEERMKLKKRRNRKGSRGGSNRSNHSNVNASKSSKLMQNYDARGPSRSTDTPEEIAAKRAARKAKRERLERERLEREKLLLDIENALDSSIG